MAEPGVQRTPQCFEAKWEDCPKFEVFLDYTMGAHFKKQKQQQKAQGLRRGEADLKARGCLEDTAKKRGQRNLESRLVSLEQRVYVRERCVGEILANGGGLCGYKIAVW